MSVEKALCSILSGNSAVEAIIGTNILPLYVPQGVSLPVVTYQQISAPRDHVMAGPSGFVAARFQINCWADSYAAADNLADKVRSALDGYSGTVNSTVIQAVHLLDEGDISSIRPEIEELNNFGKRLDFEIWFDE